MYCLSDSQIEYIINDIRARGVEMDSLQQDILDHVCCIIEQNLEENGDFKRFYSSTITMFYKTELKEIEEETISLLTNKNYYTMKKVMIYSGTFSATLLSLGIVLKFLHLPGAAMGIVLGIATLSLVFLPLMFALKIKEKQESRDKLLIGLGTLCASIMTLFVLFRVQHWPGAMIMGYTTIGILLLVFLPIYLTSGIRRPETKVNTIVSSVLLVSGCGLWLTLIASPAATKMRMKEDTMNYLNSELLLMNEQKLAEKEVKPDSANSNVMILSKQITEDCESLRASILEEQIGQKAIGPDFENKNVMLGNSLISIDDDELARKFTAMKKNIKEYNTNVSVHGLQPIPEKGTVLDLYEIYSLDALNDFIRIEMFVLQNERALAGAKLASSL